MKKRTVTFVNKCAETGETLDELRERIGEEAYQKRIEIAHDKAMFAVGYVPENKTAAQ